MTKIQSQKELENEYKLLMLKLDLANSEYATGGDTTYTDEEYDMMLQRLSVVIDMLKVQTGVQYPAIGVGRKETTGVIVPRDQPMMSLDALYSFEEVEKAYLKMGEPKLIGSAKIDGVALEITYLQGNAKVAVTRGDGMEGRDVSFIIDYINQLPLYISPKESGVDTLIIRGELTSSIHSWQKTINPKMGGCYASPRHLTVAAITSPSSANQIKPSLNFIACDVVNFSHMDYSDVLSNLSGLGFEIPIYSKVKCREFLFTAWDYFKRIFFDLSKEDVFDKDANLFVTDGAVFRVDSRVKAIELGYGSRSPNFAFSAKYPRDYTWTKLKGIEYQVGALGGVTPVLKLEPAVINGVEFSSISLYNTDHIEGLFEGSEIGFIRGGECGPVWKATKNTGEVGKKLVPPRFCPECNKRLGRRPNDTGLFCNNTSCVGRVCGTILKGLKILGVKYTKEEYVRILIDQRGINGIGGFIDHVCKKEVSGEPTRHFQKLRDQLDNIVVKPGTFIAALCIPHISVKIAEKVADNLIPIIEGEYDESHFFFGKLPKQVVDSLQWFIKDVDDAKLLLDNVTIKKQEKAAPVLGTVVITGGFPGFTRSIGTQLLEESGYKVVNRLSSKVNLLICGENPSDDKLTEAKRLKIPVMTLSEVLPEVKTKIG